jgi:hypothetical protein
LSFAAELGPAERGAALAVLVLPPGRALKPNQQPRSCGRRDLRERIRVKSAARRLLCSAAGDIEARGSFHTEFIANAEANKEEENGAEDGLNGAQDFERGGEIFDVMGIEKILAEAEDVEGIGETEAKGFFDGERVGKYEYHGADYATPRSHRNGRA